MKISKREMILTVSTLTCVLFGATWLVVGKMYDDYRKQGEEMPRIDKNIENHLITIDQQKNWKSNLNKLEASISGDAYPAEPMSVAPRLTTEIKAITTYHGLNISSSTAQKEEKTGNLYEQIIRLQWTGTTEQLVNSLHGIQNSGTGLKFDITTLTITPQSGRTAQAGMLSGTMDVNCTYMRVPPQS
ncbi:MAG: hypothetical protein GXY61_04715 [Lentisphaerae bacterium]|jgi:hypothetical protein|nr:hypothetical protein [Lentisphaerota bacterium]